MLNPVCIYNSPFTASQITIKIHKFMFQSVSNAYSGYGVTQHDRGATKRIKLCDLLYCHNLSLTVGSQAAKGKVSHITMVCLTRAVQ